MFKIKLSVFFMLCWVFINCFALEYNKYRYTQNTDFLLHEAGVNQNFPKNDNGGPQVNNGYPALQTSSTTKSDFPPLRSPSSSQTTPHPQNIQHGTRTTQSTGRRDYVAPNYPALKPPTNSQNGGGDKATSSQAQSQVNHNTQPGGKRDYVAPNYPPLKPPANTQIAGGHMVTPTQTQSHTNQNNQPGGRRDYVAPNYPPLKPPTSTQNVGHTSGTLRPTANSQHGAFDGNRDYVNPNIPFNNSPNTQQGKVKDLINFYDNKNQQPNPSKMPSYSSIVSGTTQPASTVTTAKPTSLRPTNPKSPSTTRPFVPPSSIVNNNRNQGTTGNDISNTELQTLSEELLRKDTNNAAKYITINYQGRTTSHSKDDQAAAPLLTISPEAWNIPTIQKFLPLLDNYERDTLVNEYVTPQERNEENAFMDAIMSTAVVRHLMTYLKEKGYVTPDPKQQRDFLKQLWFSLYSRGKGKISSSGFEHSFVSELKNGEVSGLHNWIYLSKEEQANHLNYLGYLKYEDLNGKGAVIKLHFNHNGVDKPVGTIFVGTSPELEISLYTLCFVTRADNDCNLKLGGKDVNIKTYTFRYRSKNLIGSAFPQI